MALGSESQVRRYSASQAKQKLRLCSFVARARVELYEPLRPGAPGNVAESVAVPAQLLSRLALAASVGCGSEDEEVHAQAREGPSSTLRSPTPGSLLEAQL